MVKQTIQKNGCLDGMVYAAGISMSMPLQMFKPQKLQSLFDVNFFAFVESVRQATKKGRYHPGMRIVGISSIASLKGDKTHLGYSASKAAMDAAVRCIAKEVANKGICINTVAPGMTATGMLSRFTDHIGSDSESMKELKSRQYLGVIQPEAVASTIAFLMSPAAEYITGITLPVDGGMTTC
jgi:NAD(P)-dependent dehydrogenase (short-subunit alcohol dehydrogenase family)